MSPWNLLQDEPDPTAFPHRKGVPVLWPSSWPSSWTTPTAYIFSCAGGHRLGHSTPDGSLQGKSRRGQLLSFPCWPGLFLLSPGCSWDASAQSWLLLNILPTKTHNSSHLMCLACLRRWLLTPGWSNSMLDVRAYPVTEQAVPLACCPLFPPETLGIRAGIVGKQFFPTYIQQHLLSSPIILAECT